MKSVLLMFILKVHAKSTMSIPVLEFELMSAMNPDLGL